MSAKSAAAAASQAAAAAKAAAAAVSSSSAAAAAASGGGGGRGGSGGSLSASSSSAGHNNSSHTGAEDAAVLGVVEDSAYSSSTPLPPGTEVPISLAHLPDNSASKVSLSEWLLSGENESSCISLQLPAQLPFRTRVVLQPSGGGPADGGTGGGGGGGSAAAGIPLVPLPHDDIATFEDPRTVLNGLSFAATTTSGEPQVLKVGGGGEGEGDDDGDQQATSTSTLGKLRVHESGRVTMLIGGVEFDVERAIDTSFLQEAAEISLHSSAQSRKQFEDERTSTTGDGFEPGVHFYSSGTIKMLGTIDQRVICTPNIRALLQRATKDEES
jgi:hypothetical protein